MVQVESDLVNKFSVCELERVFMKLSKETNYWLTHTFHLVNITYALDSETALSLCDLGLVP